MNKPAEDDTQLDILSASYCRPDSNLAKVTWNTMIYEIKQSCKFKFVKLYFNLKYKFFDLAKNITVFWIS